MPGRRAAPAPRRRGRAARAVVASRSTSSTSAFGRALELGGPRLVADGREVHDHVRGGGVRRGDGEQARDLEVRGGVGVAAAGQRLGEPDELPARLDGPERDLGRDEGRGADRGGARGPLVLGLPRQLHRGAEPRVGLRVLVGEREEPVRERACRGAGLGVERRGARRTAAGPTGPRPSRRGAAPRLPAIAAALPPPGTGSPEASRSTNSSTVRSRKRAVGSTRRIVGRGPTAGPERCARWLRACPRSGRQGPRGECEHSPRSRPLGVDGEEPRLPYQVPRRPHRREPAPRWAQQADQAVG